MKIKISTVLLNDKDNVLKESNGKNLTVREVCINALLIPQTGDDEKTKWDKYELYKRIKAAKDTIDLPSEDIVFLKKAIGKTQPPLIMGQAWEVLESKI